MAARWVTIPGLAILALGMSAVLGAPRAAVADDVEAFTIHGVSVDAQGENAEAARDNAFSKGQRKAFKMLVERMVDPAEQKRFAGAGDGTIAPLVADVEVENERVSPKRYVGTLAVRFRADPVRNLLGQAGASFNDRPAPVVVVLPVEGSQTPLLWEDGNAWRDAWAKAPPTGSHAQLVVPLGDGGDVSTISGASALAGDPARLGALAQRYSATGVAVAILETGSRQRLTLVMFDVASGRSLPPQTVGVDKGDGDMMVRAESAIAQAIDAAWRRAGKMDPGGDPNAQFAGRTNAVSAVMPISALEQWASARQRIAAVPGVRRVELRSLSRPEAKVDIVYDGDPNGLAAALTQAGIAAQAGQPGEPLSLGLMGGERP